MYIIRYLWIVPITYTTNNSATFDRGVHFKNITWLNDTSGNCIYQKVIQIVLLEKNIIIICGVTTETITEIRMAS